MADTLVARTTLHAPPDEVYALLCDVEGFEGYTEHIRGVTRRGDGDVGTEYGVALTWWKLSYTARFRVTDLDPPERITWRFVTDVDASGEWRLEPTTVDDPAVEAATRVTLTADYDPASAREDALSLPPLVSISRVVELVKPVVRREAERVLERVTADLEGTPRRPELVVEY